MKKLALLNIRRTRVKTKKTGGNSKTKKEADSVSFAAPDLICSILNNPTDKDQLHFGLAIKTSRICEAYHGTLWSESCLAGISDYPIRNSNQQSLRPGRFVSATPSNSPYAMTVQITAIFRKAKKASAVSDTVFDDDLTSTERHRQLDITRDNIWVTVRPIARQISDFSLFFAYGSGCKEAELELKLGHPILLCISYDIPLSKVGFIVDDIDTEQYTSTLRKYVGGRLDGKAIIRTMLEPERGYEVDKDLFSRDIPPSRRPSLPPRMLSARTRTRSVTPYATRHQNRPDEEASEEPSGKIHFRSLLPIKHLRKLLAEDEIEYGEVTEEMLESKTAVPRICVVIDMSEDGFGVFRSTHRVADGLYFSILNASRRIRDQLRNRYVLPLPLSSVSNLG